ncbi:hypothetical protein R6Q59_014940 [Mikania micrantha]
MGDVAFRAVVNDLYQRLVSKVIKELALLWGLEDNISNLRNDFDQIKADLEDAEETPMIIKEKAQELCLKRLRSALLMIENLLQDISAEALLCRLYKERGIIDRVRTLFCCKHNQLMFRFRIVHRIKAIRRKLEDLDYKRSFNTPRKTTHIDMGFEGHMPDRETSSRMHDSSIIFGRNEEAEMVINKICGKDIQKDYFSKILVYGIWGMGDDVWIEDDEKTKWDELREILSCGKEGSIVVITTRSQVTTRMVTTFSNLQHELGFLSKDDSWLLFKHFAFAEGRVNGGDISELEPIGREIVDICKGLPLAIKTLGSSMWSKTSASEWERVKRNTIWEENKILTALKLSCDNLVPYLKRCFAYCGLFPKGYEMEKDDMIQLWIVNGFVPPREGVEFFCDNLYELPESICHLKLLTYLNLSESSIVVLPESITNLHNLQSLILSSCRNLYKLPERLGFMRKLHHLHIYGCYSLRYRILSWFPVCDDHICGAKIEELGNLNLIEGELEILGLQNVKGGSSEAKSANLSCKRNLLHLGLNWSHTKMFDSDKQVLEGDKQVLEGLEPNRLLKILKISGYEGNIISPSWMANLRNLVEIQLYWCKNCEHLPPTLVRLPNLKFIKMVLMDSLKCFHDEKEEIMFLCLQELDISMCENLVFLPKNIPKLKILKIRSCDKLVSLACSFPNLEVLKVTKYKELGYLPDNLLKLKNLYLNGCNKILSLPKDIQSFKDMKELVILGCKHLSEKCKKHKGEDWSKISHISDIEIEVTST